MTLNNDALIKKDRLRFTKNKFSANMSYLAIVVNALYFVSIYSSDVGSWYYRIMIGGSVLYNLVFMLVAFLSSEGVKGYKIGYGYALLVLGVMQVLRIFFIPIKAHTEIITLGEIEELVMGDGQFILVCAYLVASAALCIIAGVVAIAKTTTLRAYEAQLEKRGSKT